APANCELLIWLRDCALGVATLLYMTSTTRRPSSSGWRTIFNLATFSQLWELAILASTSISFLSGFESIVRQHESLAPHTWMGIGGPVEYFAEPRTIDELQAIVRRASEHELPIRVLGGGSNLLVRDEGLQGVVIRLSAGAFHHIETAKNRLMAGGGA